MTLKRSSAQKRMIRQILERSDHPTAAEIYEHARRDCPNISLGTVYRNLAAMAEVGEVLRLSFSGRPDRFDPNTHDHFHVFCKECGRIFDTGDTLSNRLIAELDQAIELSTGVKVQERTLHFSGICELCNHQSDAFVASTSQNPQIAESESDPESDNAAVQLDPQAMSAAKSNGRLAKPVVNGAEAEPIDYR